MQIVLFALGATLVVGSVCGVFAMERLAALTRRFGILETRLRVVEIVTEPLVMVAAPARAAPVASSIAALAAPAAASIAAPLAPSIVAAIEAPLAPTIVAPVAAPLAATIAAPVAATLAASVVAPVAAPLAATIAAPVAATLAASVVASVTPFAAPMAAPVVASTAPVKPFVAPKVAPVHAPVVAPDPEQEWWRAFELRVGTRWITWLGASALVIAAALFIKLAIDRDWLGPTARLALGAAGGLGLLLAGRRAHGAEMRPLAHGLFGAGLGVLYVSMYVAFASYGLLTRELVIAAMIGVTILGCALALHYDAQSVAVLATLGGLITPIAVSSGDGSREALLAYLLVLDLGAVSIANVRRWPALELIAVAGTWLLFGGWLDRYHAGAAWPVELAWLAVFHVLFLVVPFAVQLRRAVPLGFDRLQATIVNAAVACGFAIFITDGRRGVLGVIALVMAAGYLVLAAVIRRRRAGDRAEAGLVALALVLATASVPLLLHDGGVTLAWSLEAPALLAIAGYYRHRPIRLASAAVLGFAMVHAASLYWPAHGGAAFDGLRLATVAVAPLGAALYAAVHHLLRDRGEERDRWHGIAAALAATGGTLLIAHTELARALAEIDTGARYAALSLVWAAGALFAAAVATQRFRAPIIGFAITSAVFAGGLVFAAYQMPSDPAALLALNLRFAVALVAALAGAALAMVISRHDRASGRRAWTAVIAGLGLVIGAEAYLHYAPAEVAAGEVAAFGRRAHTALSIAWSGYAAVLLAIGFARRLRPLRLAGLGLLGVIAIKLLVIDLADASQVYRVLSFLIVGALMIAASYAYHRLERRSR